MPIGEFAKRSGLSPKRLRSYAAVGLLVPAAVDSGSSYRYYSPRQLGEAQVIDTLRQAGLALSEIAVLVRSPSAEILDALAQRVDDEAGQRKEALTRARRLLALDAPAGSISPGFRERKVMTILQTACRTETGPVRENNEDTVVSNDRLAIVADGMGGPPGGEIASALAASVVEAAFTGSSLEELEAAVRAANRAVWERAGSNELLGGMGTTICVVGITEDGRAALVHVGDSRAYLLHEDSLTQLTHDHSLTAELVRRGELTEEQATDHPQRGVLIRALGVGPDVNVDGSAHQLVPGDRLLLCTDGLTNELTLREIRDLMTTADDLDGAAEGLVFAAVSRGGRDNVSVVVALVASVDNGVL